ncbi:MAG: hypothetical protein GFH27_549285n49 [Chloroflexi bacterium AL-W]|nr:hypothetical protein [Chloroflexi bacterium AL-N1]NOK65561.1 hypothetical protein [Chloroflexi bacterium AL-N10]NOK74498.1 hypothetical protein [Chloroflexi bacterium AL-N5]NOK80594.1 hypothetical protein [Chloroflexi bacterium AL-W]NOK88756.1 hypothetical protein [Chloroflexi bacterium AL-N15]
MIVNNTFRERTRPWLIDHLDDFGRLSIGVIVLCGTWWITSLSLSPVVGLSLIGYCFFHLLLIGLRYLPRFNTRSFDGVSLILDISFAVVLLSQVANLGNGIYPLYFIVALRVLSVYQQLPIATIIPFILGPTYLFAQALLQQNPLLSPSDQIARWVLLVGSLGFGAMAIWTSAVQQHINATLREELATAKKTSEQRVGQLESTANDLRGRMREQHALEEGLRIITSTLSLDEVLDQIVDSSTHMFSSARIHGSALSLYVDDAFEHRSLMLEGCAEGKWTDILAQRVVQQQTPLLITNIHDDDELSLTATPHMSSALSVPLFVGEGKAQGALTIVSPVVSAFSSSDARHLTAFAIQAGIAIGNAELHSQLRHQQHLLSAVIRDISDGLIVINAQLDIVLTNPLGRSLLESYTVNGALVRNQLIGLAESMRTSDQVAFMCELCFGEDETVPDKVYQAFASRVHQNSGGETLIAIVLHDVTAQKNEERSRSEFISMVAHELRNPLNSLNGFIKIVLQGRAGELTPLQEEFLGIADGQVEQLKGRISELLEYNRLEAGRLVLNPQWDNIPSLIDETIIRLSLQAEQAGIHLTHTVDYELPESYFDSERIGQVVTNLVENAIKASPDGGSITVFSELYDDEIWIGVRDTGVGIPEDERLRIFQAFYRAHDRASSRGNHLGLGLAICQQIIEGHNGRIWVESEPGQGSCFTFALPLIQQERAVGV